MTQKELIGLNAKIAKSSNIHNLSVNGTVVDETKNTITIKTLKGKKTMIKRQNTFEFEKNKNVFLIDGKLIEKRPEERIKK